MKLVQWAREPWKFLATNSNWLSEVVVKFLPTPVLKFLGRQLHTVWGCILVYQGESSKKTTLLNTISGKCVHNYLRTSEGSQSFRDLHSVMGILSNLRKYQKEELTNHTLHCDEIIHRPTNNQQKSFWEGSPSWLNYLDFCLSWLYIHTQNQLWSI